MFFKNKKREIEKQVNELRDHVFELIDKNDWMEIYSFARIVETEAVSGLDKYGSRASEEEIMMIEMLKMMSDVTQKLTKKLQKELDG